MKFTKKHENALREFMANMDANGCLATKDWTTGTGRFTKPRALPPFVKRFEKGKLESSDGSLITEMAATRYFASHPHARVVYVLNEKAMFDFLFSAAHLKEF